MSVIAALDSGGDLLSVAVHIDGEIIYRTGTDAPHSEQALPMLMGLLSDNGLSADSCDAFAFAAGPGKFSALRLVCAIAKTFAYAKNKPLIAVSSLAALAEANMDMGGNSEENSAVEKKAEVSVIKCAIPAHRQHAYFAVCRRDENLWRTTSLKVISADAPPPAKGVKDACGEGFAVYPQLLGGAHFRKTAAYSNAAVVARLACTMFANGDTISPLICEPHYVRKQIAQTVAMRTKIKMAKK